MVYYRNQKILPSHWKDFKGNYPNEGGFPYREHYENRASSFSAFITLPLTKNLAFIGALSGDCPFSSFIIEGIDFNPDTTWVTIQGQANPGE